MRPTPGKYYTVVRRDTLWDIAGAAYGNPRKWRIIYDANKAKLKDPKIYPQTVVFIYPGEKLWIPLDGEKEKLDSELKEERVDDPGEKLRFVMNGEDLSVTSGRAVCSIDTLADGFSFSVDTAGAPHIKPFGFEQCDVYIDDTKIITGLIFQTKTRADSNGEILDVSGFSTTKRVVNSVAEPPYQYKQKTIKQILTKLTAPFSVIVSDEVNDSYKFKKMKIGYEEPIGQFLLKLAGQRRVLLRSTDLNEISIIRANTSGEPVINVSDESVLVDPISVNYDGTKRFSKYIALGKNPKRNVKGIFKDENISSYATYAKRADELDSSEIDSPAEWFARKAFIDSLGLSFKIDGFYRDGILIRENKIVSVEKATLGIPGGKNFLIKSVEYEQSPDSKFTTIDFTLPEVYTDEPIIEEWGFFDA